MSNRITIAIDGYSSCGKSTLAKALAAALGYVYVDTGAMYRAVTLHALEHGFIRDGALDGAAVLGQLETLDITFRFNLETRTSETMLNGRNVEHLIRNMEVSQWVSPVSALPEVRTKMVTIQRVMGRNGGLVMDGRDIGTVVFPKAELKLFMTASEAVRAQRRYDELTANGKEVTLEAVRQNLHQRDYEDTHRATSPLRQAADAVVIDNSDLTREAQLTQAIALAKERMAASRP